MTQKDTRDIVGGLVMTTLGSFAAWHAHGNYELGELNRMGPGYFPIALGILLAFLGLLIAIPAIWREGEAMEIKWKSFLLVCVSITVFGLLLKTLGLIVATIVAVILSSLADDEIKWRTRIIAGVTIAVITWLVFGVGLSMVLPMWPWSN